MKSLSWLRGSGPSHLAYIMYNRKSSSHKSSSHRSLVFSSVLHLGHVKIANEQLIKMSQFKKDDR